MTFDTRKLLRCVPCKSGEVDFATLHHVALFKIVGFGFCIAGMSLGFPSLQAGLLFLVLAVLIEIREALLASLSPTRD